MGSTSSLTRVQQILVGALLFGCLAFGGLVFVMVQSGRVEGAQLSSWPFALALALLGGVAVMVPVWSRDAFLQRLREHLRAGDAQAAGQVIVSRTVLQAALLEGFGIAGGSFAFVNGELLFTLAPLLAAVGLGLMFPTERKTCELLESCR